MQSIMWAKADVYDGGDDTGSGAGGEGGGGGGKGKYSYDFGGIGGGGGGVERAPDAALVWSAPRVVPIPRVEGGGAIWGPCLLADISPRPRHDGQSGGGGENGGESDDSGGGGGGGGGGDDGKYSYGGGDSGGAPTGSAGRLWLFYSVWPRYYEPRSNHFHRIDPSASH